MQGQGTRHTYSPPRTWLGSPSLRCHGDRNGGLSRELPYNASGTGYQLGSLWVIDAEPKNHPYLLDWYYTSRNQQTTGHTQRVDIPTGPFEEADKQRGDYWMPSNLTQNEARYEEYWGHHYGDRSESHLEASTSAPFFRESVLQHHDTSNLVHPSRSHWWARSGPHATTQPQSSFLEPPDFNQYTAHINFYDNSSERSLEEQEQFLDSRNSHKLSRTAYMDDLEAGGDVNLHFDDVYSKPPETPIVNPEPPRF